MQSIVPQEYKLRSELLRGAWIFFFGLVIARSVNILFRYYNGHPINLAEIKDCIIPLVVFSLGILWVNHIRLYIDDTGIYDRYFFKWRHWYWEDFKNGKIQRGFSIDSFIYPMRRMFRFPSPTLRISIFDEKIADSLLDYCLKIWVPPPASPLPKEIKISIDSFSKNSTLFTPDGILFDTKNKKRFYQWAEVKEIEIHKADHKRTDFRNLIISLPDETINLGERIVNYMRKRNWKGADNDTINLYISNFAPKERIIDIAKSGPPKTLKEAEYRLADINKRYLKVKSETKFIIFFSIIVIPLLLSTKWHFVQNFNEHTLLEKLIFIFLVILFAPSICILVTVYKFMFYKKNFINSVSELEKWKQDLLSGKTPS